MSAEDCAQCRQANAADPNHWDRQNHRCRYSCAGMCTGCTRAKHDGTETRFNPPVPCKGGH